MKKLILIATALTICLSQNAFGWGRAGHDAVAAIAERNLSPKAKKTIEKYLGHSIVYYASWMDEYRKSAGYEMTTRWHTGSVDKDFKSTDAVRRPTGDCVAELENAIARLKHYKELDDSTVVVNLKYIIHIVGDMHCPSHISYPDAKIKYVKYMGQKMSYHSVWDSGVLGSCHRWSYIEFADQLDRLSKKEQKAITAGTPADWFEDNARNCRVIYEWASEGAELGKPFINRSRQLVDDQITKGGYRLAKVLNDLF